MDYSEKKEIDKKYFGNSYEIRGDLDKVIFLINEYKKYVEVDIHASIDKNNYQENCLFVKVYEKDSGICLFWAWGGGINLFNSSYEGGFRIDCVGNCRFNDNDRNSSSIEEIKKLYKKIESENKMRACPYENKMYNALKEVCDDDLDWAIAEGLI